MSPEKLSVGAPGLRSNTVTQSESAAVQGAITDALLTNDLAGATRIACTIADQSSPAGLLVIADYLLKRSQSTRIIELLAPWADKFTDTASLQWALGAAYYSIRQRAKAVDHLRIVTKLKPHWPDPHFFIANSLFGAGDPEAAIPELRQTLALKPDHPQASDLLAAALSAVGEYAEAMKYATGKSSHQAQYMTELGQLTDAAPPKAAFRRWPTSPDEFDDLASLYANYFAKDIPTQGIKLRRRMRVFTQGSCFARNLATSLQRYDLDLKNLPCGEQHNNTFSNRVVVNWLVNGVVDENTKIAEGNIGAERREEFLEALRNTDLFVYTMGLAAAHFDRQTGAFVMSRDLETSKAALFRRCDFRNTSVQDNIANLLHILTTVRTLAPQAAMILTVSPVPLRVATEFHSAIIADCVSKSTLRVAVNEVIAMKLPRTMYWPSFEMIRWVGGNTGRIYGVDDRSTHHPNLAAIDQIMDSFIDVFGDAELKATKRA